MGIHNSVPVPQEEPGFTRQEELAWEQGITTPYMFEEDEHPGPVSHVHHKQYPHKPRQTGHVHDFTSDSDLDPEWNSPPDPNVVPANPELRASLVKQVHAQILRNHVAYMVKDGASMKEIEAVIRKHEQRYGRSDDTSNLV